MQILKTTDLRDLLKNQTFPCISLYLNMGETIQDRKNAKVRLKGFLKTAGDVLEQTSPVDSQSFLLQPLMSQVNDLVRNPISNARSLAFFRSYRTAAVFPIDQPVADYLAINDSFHMKPLLTSLQDQDLYYAIVLNHRHIRLYCGRKHSFDLVQTFAPPQEEFAQNLGAQERAGAPRGRITRYRTRTFPSTGRVETFIRESEREISRLITNLSAPIILLGSPLMRRFYRQANRHPGLLKEEVSATFGAHETETIHRTTMPIIEREFARRAGTVSTAFKKMKSSAGASDNLEEVVKGVIQGRVSNLLISQNDKIFGRLHRADGTVMNLDPDISQIGDDILCDIAQIVLLSGGTAYVLPKDEMPTSSPLAALYRW